MCGTELVCFEIVPKTLKCFGASQSLDMLLLVHLVVLLWDLSLVGEEEDKGWVLIAQILRSSYQASVVKCPLGNPACVRSKRAFI